MDKMQSFSPKNLEEYHTFFNDNKEMKFLIFAGGTDLMIDRFSLEDSIIIDISHLEVCFGIEADEKHVTIGAASTLNEILYSQEVQAKIPILVDAIKTMASIQVRNRATIGGNVGNASPAGDTITPLVVLGASLQIYSPEAKSERNIPLSEYFCGPCTNTLENGEFITKINIPIPSEKMKYYFRKVGQRNAMTITKASLSCLANIENNEVLDIRFAAGSVSPTVQRLTKTEDFLTDNKITDITIEEAKKILAKEIHPITDIRSTKVFRMLLTKNLLVDCLRTIIY